MSHRGNGSSTDASSQMFNVLRLGSDGAMSHRGNDHGADASSQMLRRRGRATVVRWATGARLQHECFIADANVLEPSHSDAMGHCGKI